MYYVRVMYVCIMYVFCMYVYMYVCVCVCVCKSDTCLYELFSSQRPRESPPAVMS